MKPMNDRGLKMKKGEHESFFPSAPHMKTFPRVGEVREHKYPDTEEMIHRDQQGMVKDINATMQKDDMRH